MINTILQQALANQGRFESAYDKQLDRAVRELINTQIQTDSGQYSVVFFHQVDKKADKIFIQLSKTALDNQDLLLKSSN
ncbi:hypothetical protein HR060_06335 [Catenovulum sp. SM1970]|uniref:hypothetical protein n=1 Tax=Marinifaba aquimaris TaxID=2741323 RepID=UPI0015727365|nr:hypothetical protein [Marinifaba aquimaris]NTS76484.1 hypothetical protein [Marinifaba aquimaris]